MSERHLAEYVPDEVDLLRVEVGSLRDLLSDLADACIQWHVEESEAGHIGAESLDDVPTFCRLAYIARRQVEHSHRWDAHIDGGGADEDRTDGE